MVKRPPDAKLSTAASTGAEFSDLTIEECEELLARTHVGRIAYVLESGADIEPIGYVFDRTWLFGRTSPGTKLTALGHRPWVAFEVDEVEGRFDWQSVVVHGSFRVLASEGSEHDVRLYERAEQLVRSVDPLMGTRDDPASFRTVLFGIHIDDMVGRRARSYPPQE
jgi:nitroimidazol reductase NimA-like FMN-containing flavoprotein (pyridoxamine 5'-phosphate oxidase superfamily)